MEHNFKIGDLVYLKTHDSSLLFSVIGFPNSKSENAIADIQESSKHESEINIRRYNINTDEFKILKVHHFEIERL